MALPTADSLGNGVTEGFGYDSQTLQLTSRTATAPGGATGGLMNLSFSYQATAGQLGVGTTAGTAGQLVSISNSSINGVAESAAYSYDDLSRLISSSQTTNAATTQRRFAYDVWGNRTGEWDSVSGGNQIQSVTLAQSGGVPTNQIQSVTTSGNPVSYSYDAGGNLTGDGVHTYAFDGENRIRSVDGGGTAVYNYDYKNRRVKRNAGGVITHYIWEGNKVIAEYNVSSGAQIVDYVFAGGRLIGEGTGSSFTTSSTFTYPIGDKVSRRLLVDKSGNVLGRQAHLPFGELRSVSQKWPEGQGLGTKTA
jgi:hypothetical protein